MSAETTIWISIICIPLIAFLYASVGHGGASGYLALMTIMGMSQATMKPTALLLNILVSTIAFLYFWTAGYFKFRLFMLFAAGSIPFSFIGGMIETDPFIYKMILGIFLAIATLKLIGVFDIQKKIKSESESQSKSVNIYLAVLIGIVIGFFSGLIGIGGGIILSPVIILLGWGNLKESAAVSALFILVNSLSGFAGQLTTGVEFSTEIIMMAALAAFGGLCGAYYGTFKFNNTVLKKVLACVLLFASIKLLIV